MRKDKELLIEHIKRSVDPKKEVLMAMKKIRREDFIARELSKHAYADNPLPTKEGQTISQPSIIALMTDMLDLKKGQRVLEIGSGSGYQAAIMAEIVKPKGHVYSVEKIEKLVEFSRKNLERAGYSEYVTVIKGDGSEGFPPKAPYDRIMVTAACPALPKPLTEQLKDPGIMILPVGGRYLQNLIKVEKGRGKIKESVSIPCVFVPLLGKHGF